MQLTADEVIKGQGHQRFCHCGLHGAALFFYLSFCDFLASSLNHWDNRCHLQREPLVSEIVIIRKWKV